MVAYTPTRRHLLQVTGTVGLAGLAGCAGQNDDDSDGSGDNGGEDGGEDDGDEETVSLAYAGGDQTSAQFQTAIPWGEQIRRHADVDIQLDAQTTGGLDANVRGVGSGDFDVGATTSPNFQAADAGVRPFEEEHDINMLFTNMVYPFPIGFTQTGRDIGYLEELEGKAVATGRPGSSTHTYFKIYCQVNGIDFESMDVQRITGDDMYRQLDSGRLDAVLTAGVNTVLGPTTQQWLQRTDEAKLVVPVDTERAERLSFAGQHIDELPYDRGGILFDFPLETFQHAHENSEMADEDSYTTVAGTNTQFATMDMSDEVAYEITRVALERREELAEANALWAGFAEDPEFYATAITPEDTVASPVHPGAKQAMEEFDVWDDDLTVAER
ncbi:MAG: TAXI family TRAP transporter solute-binding subunit [Natronomonas sp.]